MISAFSIISASSIQLDNCDTVDDMRESGENIDEPESFREYVTKCIAEIDSILNVENWPQRMSSIAYDILEHFDGYDAYDEPMSYEERRNAESELEEGVWTEYLLPIALESRAQDRMIQSLVSYYTSSYGSKLIEKSVRRDARTLGRELEDEKPRLRLRKELMELELDTRRRSVRIADKKRKRLNDSTLPL